VQVKRREITVARFIKVKATILSRFDGEQRSTETPRSSPGQISRLDDEIRSDSVCRQSSASRRHHERHHCAVGHR
jgi:hypothetical protein